MPIVTEVHSISAAGGWYGYDPSISRAEELKPVACFALVSTVDPAYPIAGTARAIVAVPESLLNDDLVGKDSSEFPPVIHESTTRKMYDWPDTR